VSCQSFTYPGHQSDKGFASIFLPSYRLPFIFLDALIFDKVQILFLNFPTCFWCHNKKLLLNPGAKRFIILLFPSKNFIVLAL
jgi:hypothetical protein